MDGSTCPSLLVCSVGKPIPMATFGGVQGNIFFSYGPSLFLGGGSDMSLAKKRQDNSCEKWPISGLPRR